MKRACLLAALLAACETTSFAQDATGRILGSVTDPSGASIPAARVTVTNTATQVTRATLTDNQGNYQVLELPIGAYQVTVEKEGFSRAATAAQNLLINQSLRIDVTMAVGATMETVQVEALVSKVETDAFNANAFFNNMNRISKPILKRNQFGATAGGACGRRRSHPGARERGWIHGEHSGSSPAPEFQWAERELLDQPRQLLDRGLFRAGIRPGGQPVAADLRHAGPQRVPDAGPHEPRLTTRGSCNWRCG